MRTRPGLSGWLAIGAMELALAACASTTPSVEAAEDAVREVTPEALLANASFYDQLPVKVVGWMSIGFERRFLLQRSPAEEASSETPQSCITVELNPSVYGQAAALNETFVVVEGRFFADLAAERVFLGMCSPSGLKVDRVEPLTRELPGILKHLQ